MAKKPFEPNFKTSRYYQSREENNKLMAPLRKNELEKAFRDNEPDVEWQVEQLAKSYGIYLEFNRAIKDPNNKEWIYMVRISNPGGGPISREQWLLYDELSEKYCDSPDGNKSIRLTTRQNIQFHWLKKKSLIDVISTLAEKDMRSINGCGDNTRNVMGCPLARYSDIFNANEWANKVGDYFQLPLAPYLQIFEIDPQYVRDPEQSYQYGPQLLNRKFKIAFSAIHKCSESAKLVADNCVELLTNDLAVAPILKNNKVSQFQIYIGGGQGERNGKPTMAALAKPFAIVTENQLLVVLDAIVKVHEQWGDRQNRHWARLKYVVKVQGIEWYREQVSARLGFPLQKPSPDHDFGDRHMHHGWHQQPTNGHWTFGAYIENGRITDHSPNGKLKTMLRDIMKKYDTEMLITSNQDVLFTNIPENDKEKFESDLKSYGYGQRNNKDYSTLRKLSGACVGRDTCRLTYTDSEQFEPELIDELEEMGWGDLSESIGITGCERQCFRPSTKTIGLIGTGLNRYQLRLFGNEGARFQGAPLISSDGESMYLRSIPRDRVAKVLDALFKHYQENKNDNEGLGEFNRRLGAEKLIEFFKSHDASADLMKKPFNTDCVLE